MSYYSDDGTVHEPWHAAVFKSLLYVHVFAFKVHDDDAEIVILGLSMKVLHVRDKLLHPPSLVFH